MTIHTNVYFLYAYLDPRVECNLETESCKFFNEPFYVGYGKGERHLSHLREILNHGVDKTNPHKGRRIKNIIDDGCLPIILKLKESLSFDEARKFEFDLIKQIGTRTPLHEHPSGPLTNLREGGTGGLSQEAKRKISKSRRGQRMSEETKAKVAASVTVALQDPERRRKISETHLGKSKAPEHLKKLQNHLRELSKDPKQRAAIRQRMTGRDVPQEQRTRIGKKVSEHVKNTIWINDGVCNKRVLKDDVIPNGWARGRGKVKFSP